MVPYDYWPRWGDGLQRDFGGSTGGSTTKVLSGAGGEDLSFSTETMASHGYRRDDRLRQQDDDQDDEQQRAEPDPRSSIGAAAIAECAEHDEHDQHDQDDFKNAHGGTVRRSGAR